MLIKTNRVEDRVNNLVGRIYDTCLNSHIWPEVQEQMCSLSGGFGSHILLFDSEHKPIETLIHSALDERAAVMMEEDYMHWYHQFDDYRIDAAIQNGGDIVVTNDELTPTEKKKSCPLYNEYFRYYDAEEQIIYGNRISDRLALAIVHARPRGAGVHSESERRLFLYLAKHVQRAVEMRQQLKTFSSIKADVNEVLSDDQHSIIVVDRNRSVIWSNERAQTRLLDIQLVRQINGRVSLDNQEQNKALDKLVQQAIQLSSQRCDRCGFMRIETNRTPMLLSVFSSSIEQAMFSDRRPVAILLFNEPSMMVTPSKELIQMYYKLTQSEARLAFGLAEGKSLKECAEEYSIRLSTARSCLREVMDKMDCHRQPELVRMVLSLVS